MTDYRYIKLGFNVDFDHDGTNENRAELTDAARKDPRFVAFLALFHELRQAEIAAEIAAKGPGDLMFGSAKTETDVA